VEGIREEGEWTLPYLSSGEREERPGAEGTRVCGAERGGEEGSAFSLVAGEKITEEGVIIGLPKSFVTISSSSYGVVGLNSFSSGLGTLSKDFEPQRSKLERCEENFLTQILGGFFEGREDLHCPWRCPTSWHTKH
jgi:hypothetical protein